MERRAPDRSQRSPGSIRWLKVRAHLQVHKHQSQAQAPSTRTKHTSTSPSAIWPGPAEPFPLNTNDLLDFFLPCHCAGCGASGSGEVLCPRCQAALPWLAPVPFPKPPDAGLGPIVAAIAMRGEGRTWVHRFKYPARGLTGLDPGALGVARLLARAAGRRAPILPTDRIVPVPLHPRRFRRRGFNPAALVAREIALLHRSPLEAHWLVRVLDTRPQAGLDARFRQQNVSSAFACLRRREPVAQRVWLVDDVTTTGATLASAGQALRRAGVRVVMGVCLAQTLHPSGESEPSVNQNRG